MKRVQLAPTGPEFSRMGYGTWRLPDTNKLEHLQSAAQAEAIALEREDWHALWEAAQGRKIP